MYNALFFSAPDASLVDERRTVPGIHGGSGAIFRAYFINSTGGSSIQTIFMIQALMDKTELEIYEDIRRGGGNSLFLEEHAMRILLRLQEDDYNSQPRALRTLGKLFRERMRLPDTYSDYAAGEYLMK
ncbi:unnamed protein product [Dibothriocephalus latus]|uniref:Uncharacterized protein n=1 Tax=Dibothriocephalus latus TaxID=60516 RepID=A0A3P7LD51_DIBLA|nr:unnamed protein product [Dibothriocephalus latus]